MAGQEYTPNLSECGDLDWTDEWTAGGGSKGLPFCASQISQGHFISGIKTWEGPLTGEGKAFGGVINGIQILYEGGDYTSIGKLEGRYRELLWWPAETSVKEVALCPPNNGDRRLQGMLLTLSDGRSIYGGTRERRIYGGFKKCKTQSHGTPVAVSGWVGNFGIEQITFSMLNAKVKNGRIHDVVYKPSTEELNSRKSNVDRGLFNETVMGGHFYNDQDEGTDAITYHFKDSHTYTYTKTFTHTTSDAWHIGVGFELEHGANVIAIDAKAKEKFDFFWERKQEKTKTLTETSTHSREAWVDIPLKPGEGAHVVGYSVNGKWDATWTGKITLTFEDDKTVTLPVSGEMKDNNWSDVWLHTYSMSKKEVLKLLENNLEPFREPSGKFMSLQALNDLKDKLKKEVNNITLSVI